MDLTVRIGAGASPLSQIQTRQVQAAIAGNLGASPEDADQVAPLVLITITGDRVQDRRLTDLGGKALFTREIEAALLAGQIDCAVHSLKDVPAERSQG